jgi:hypothetical protein
MEVKGQYFGARVKHEHNLNKDGKILFELWYHNAEGKRFHNACLPKGHIIIGFSDETVWCEHYEIHQKKLMIYKLVENAWNGFAIVEKVTDEDTLIVWEQKSRQTERAYYMTLEDTIEKLNWWASGACSHYDPLYIYTKEAQETRKLRKQSHY